MKRDNWKFMKIFVAVVLLVSLLAACGGGNNDANNNAANNNAANNNAANNNAANNNDSGDDEPDEPAEPAEPVTFRLGVTWIWGSPNVNVSWTGWNTYRMIYDSVIEYKEMGVYGPGLAKSWSVDESGLVWTLDIEEGVTFHDGTPLTAVEIAWSINWMRQVNSDALAFYFTTFTDVVALDATTLQITTSAPVGNFVSLLVWAFIVPESVYGEFETHDEMADFTDISAATGGTGPYMVADYQEGEYLILEANENYWGGAPKIDRIIYQIYATQDGTVQALRAGEVDGIFPPATAVGTLQEDPNIEVFIVNNISVDELTINSHEDGTQPPSLNDPIVRLAIEYAIDRQKIINLVYLGYASPAKTHIGPVMGDWHNTDIEAIPFDIDEGNRILDEAGYLDTDGDGIREWSDGSPLEYRFMGLEGASGTRLMEVIEDGLLQVGISAPANPIAYDQQSALAYAYDFDLNYWFWGMDYDPEFGLIIFICDQLEGWGWNINGYCNAEYDALYALQAVATDHEDRVGLIWEMQEMIFNARPWIALVHPSTITAYRSDRFTGFDPASTYNPFMKYSILQVEPVE